MEILLAIIGLLTGAIITWIIYNRKLTKLLHEREQLNMDLSAKTKEAELILQQMDRLERESQEHLEEQNREADLRIQELREQSAERIREQKELMNTQLQQQMQMMQERMTNVTQQLLKTRSSELEENNSKAMEGVVNPLKEKLAELHQLVQTTRDKAQENTASVKEQIRNMLERAQEIGNEATRLTNALTHNTQFQGSMGEQVLGVILDNAGLRKRKRTRGSPEYPVSECVLMLFFTFQTRGMPSLIQKFL